MLGVFHMGIATVTSAPEWMLTEEESRELATAAVPVLDQFDWMPDPKYAAIGGLLIVAGKIYVPRVKATYDRSQQKKRPRPAPTVVPFPQPAPVAQPPVTEMQPGSFSDFGETPKV